MPLPVFCAYCGKSFTRKEHLERHIPSHTNVKPHRCSGCHLSFTRRDLLQRHHATYHEAHDPLDSTPIGPPTIQGRTPIACQNCANAKTGCDKRVPCSRCSDKNLPCAARFARRSSKAAVRAAHTNAVINLALTAQAQTHVQAHSHAHGQQVGVGGVAQIAFLDVEGLKEGLPGDVSMLGETITSSTMVKQPSPKLASDEMGEFMINGGPFATDTAYSNLLMWPAEYHMDPESMYTNYSLPPPRPDIPMSYSFDLDDISSGSSGGSIHTRGNSIMSTADIDSTFKAISNPLVSNPSVLASGFGEAIDEFPVVINAESAWPLARCNPLTYSGTCPRTAIVHLECLEQRSKDEASWSALEKYLEHHAQWDSSDVAAVMPLSQRTRDRMLAITQSFLHKALDIHRGSVSPFGKPRDFSASGPAEGNFVVLPPNNIVQYFLRSYVRSLVTYYPLMATRCVDANEMIFSGQASTLLVLLMIAQGAAGIPMTQARFLSAGLTETCRISLFDTIEKNVEFSADPVALRCAFLFMMLGAWSGDKWLMDIAMGQHGMYLSMLRHAGMLEAAPVRFTTTLDPGTINVELKWHAWQQTETQNCLVYNWVLLDQELTLFHDVSPMLAVTDLHCHLPGPEPLRAATSAEQWELAVQGLYGCSRTMVAPVSLYELFQDFLHDRMAARQRTLTPIHLRLLLHPIQAMLSHVRQLLSCFASTTASWSSNGAHNATTVRLEEAQSLLRKWYDLAISVFTPSPTDTTAQTALTLYHLLCLTSITAFPDIERLARKEGAETDAFWDMSSKHRVCILDRPEAIFHCGQVLRLVRNLPIDRRPSWWPVAIYRATVILWVDAIVGTIDPACQMARRGSGTPPLAGKNASEAVSPASQGSPRLKVVTPPESISSASSASSPRASMIVLVDQVLPEDPVLGYLRSGEGTAVLGNCVRNVFLDQPADILTYGVALVGEGHSTRFSDGIKRKLTTL